MHEWVKEWGNYLVLELIKFVVQIVAKTTKNLLIILLVSEN